MIRKETIADRPRISEVRLAVRENRLGQASVADPRDGTIFGLFIHPDFEGRGIARALLPRACEDLRAAGFGAATLTTGPGTRAERFYRANGWEEIGRQDEGQIVFRRPL